MVQTYSCSGLTFPPRLRQEFDELCTIFQRGLAHGGMDDAPLDRLAAATVPPAAVPLDSLTAVTGRELALLHKSSGTAQKSDG